MLTTEWPSQLAQFNRAARLTNREKVLLAAWVSQAPASRNEAHRDRQYELLSLQRLIQPVEAVFACCKYNDPSLKYRFACCALLLKEMHDRQTSLWGWDEATWLEIVGVTPLEFSDRYDDWQTDWLPMLPAARQLRPILVNCAYLIKKFAIHQAITGCHIASSARRILGRNAVYNAIETMRAAMEATGRSRYYNVPGLSNCLCLALLLNGLKGKLTLQELTLAQLKEVAAKPYPYKALRPACVTISELLYELGFITEVLPPVAGAFPLKARKAKIPVPERRKDLLPPQWGELLDQWGRACVQKEQAPPHH